MGFLGSGRRPFGWVGGWVRIGYRTCRGFSRLVIVVVRQYPLSFRCLLFLLRIVCARATVCEWVE